MSLVHDIIKIQMSNEGYLPNYPPHLISDEEMCDAFLNYPYDESLTKYERYSQYVENHSPSWFSDKYPLVSNAVLSWYIDLIEAIAYHVDKFKQDTSDARKLPDWVYSYMLGSTLSVASGIDNLHTLLVGLGVDNVDDIFNVYAAIRCHEVSEAWLRKIPPSQLDHRPPTVFGEPHVIKALKLQDVMMKVGE